MKLRSLAPIAAVLAATFALTACSGGYGTERAAPAAKSTVEAPATQAPAETPGGQAGAPAAPAGKPQVLTVNQVAGFSPFVTNAKGRTIYRFDNDSNSPATSTCFGACAQAWEPVLATSVQVASGAIDRDKVGSIDRPEGRQLTLNGWPLYYFATDKQLGQTEGHGKNGTWFAIAPNGTKAQRTGDAGTSAGGSSY